MQTFYKHITAISLALIVLFTTFSFTVNMHYCGDTLVDTAIFGKAKSCGMEMKKMENNPFKKCNVTKTDCCNEKQIVVTAQDELKIANASFIVGNQLFFTAVINTYANHFQIAPTQVLFKFNYIPPLVIKDIQQLDEVYLI